jgi:hypothetical protein
VVVSIIYLNIGCLTGEKVRQNRGAGGIDGESIEAFEKEAFAKLGRLHGEIFYQDFFRLSLSNNILVRAD